MGMMYNHGKRDAIGTRDERDGPMRRYTPHMKLFLSKRGDGMSMEKDIPRL